MTSTRYLVLGWFKKLLVLEEKNIKNILTTRRKLFNEILTFIGKIKSFITVRAKCGLAFRDRGIRAKN